MGAPEADKLRKDYLERSSFFLSGYIRSFQKTLRTMEFLRTSDETASLEWNIKELGIDEEAIKMLIKQDFPPQIFYCHPDILKKNPKLSAYYSSLALIPEKGLARLKLKIGPESDDERRKDFSYFVNSAINAVVLSNIAIEQIPHLVAMQMGARLEGSWRNLIGKRAVLLKQLVLEWLLKQREQVLVDSGINGEDIIENPAKVYKISKIYTEKYLVEWDDEPDMAVKRYVNGDEILRVWIEIKAGTDPAGAQERYGAVKKSFQKAKYHEDRPRTILIMDVYTPTVITSIKRDRLIDEYYYFSRLMVEGSDDYKRFFRLIKLELGL